MSSQTVMWTAVPDGVEGDQARIVCVVSPRLTDPARPTVHNWPDWENWAERAAQVSFQVRFGTGPLIAATRVSPAPEAQRWLKLVKPELAVRPFPPAQHADRKIRSYPAGNVYDFVKAKYLDVAVSSPTEFPPLDKHNGGLGQVGLTFNPKTESMLRSQIENALGQVKALPPMDANPVLDVLLATMFHEIDPAARPVQPRTDRPDFHQLLTILAQYPALQRRLGLVFDLRVPAAAAAGAATVSVVPVWTPATPGTLTVSPVTKLTSAFGPAPKTGSDLDRDLLNVQVAGFRVVTADVDGAALKVRQFADTIRRTQLARTADTPDRASLPALRSAGLAVVRTGRAARQVQRFADSAALEQALSTGNPVPLDADALLYGLRWAVYDVKAGRWFSLCERRGAYTFLADRTLDLQLADSGAITTAVTQRAQENAPDYYLAEYLCRWEGESLVAPRPGKSLDRDPKGAPGQADTDPPPDIPLKVRFAPEPGSLPPLRFGRKYRMRAQAVYLGGAGPRFVPGDTSTDFSHATAETTYSRLEPVPPPVLAARKPRIPGESLTHVVIRSDYDTAAAATVPAERHVLPPKASQLLAEQHGLFDTPHGPDPDVYPAIAARAAGTLDSRGEADPSDASQRYFNTDALSFPVENGATAAVPWLVDPLSWGAAVTGLPGGGFGATTIEFGYGEGRTWRTAQPFRIKLVEGTAGPAFDPLTRVLTVSLPKGDTADVVLASLLRQEDLPLLELWRWLQEDAGLSTPALGTHRTYALTGRHWLLTPAQPLTLVHAVRRPLVQPVFRSAVAVRTLGKPVSVLKADGMGVSRKSTVGVDVRAEWNDPVDTLTSAGWEPRKLVTKRAAVGSVPVAVADATHDENTLDLAITHDLGDTAYHSVAYYPTAKSRFAEYFTETVTATVALPDTNWFSVDARGVTPGSDTVTGGGTTYVRGTDYELNEDGMIRRLPSGRIPAGPITVTYLPASTLRGNPWIVSVPNAARPAPPAPLYIVPTFAWTAGSTSTGASSNRRGGGLRVYLDRPWWSSGDGELLGVVLWPGTTPPDASVKPYVTGWGRDPLYLSAPTPHLIPTSDDFPQATVVRGGVRLAERDVPVTVAGHTVQPDTARQLWFCDVELPPGQSHQPFVRLALARFQPNSLPGAELSHVVLADFAQLAPDRSASVTFGADPLAVNVSVNGNGYALSADGQTLGTVEVTVEQHDPGIPGDLGWVPALPPQKLAALSLSTGGVLWRGKVSLPAARGSKPMRLVLSEYDPLSGGSRLTYTDVLPL
jgi:hypothetical protein